DVAGVVRGVELFLVASGEPATFGAEQAGFSYRRSSIPEDGIVVATTLELRPGDAGDIRARMEDARAWRRRTQPLAEPNCGSVFTNPPGGHAAALIDAAGMKGYRVGGAVVSTKHANFIVAGPGATADDVAALIRAVRDRVADSSGIVLEPEVRFVGR